MNRDPRSDESLRALLRAGDPAADRGEPSREESERLRRAVLGSVRTARPARWLPLAAAAAGLLAAASLLWFTGPMEPDRGPAAGGAVTEPAEPRPPRQIRFATERGTQIIWVLNPNLDLWNQES